MSINSIGSNGSLRLNTRLSQPRTSSNQSFHEQFRSGIKNGIDLTNSALRQVAKPIPGAAALSASLSDAARNLNGASKLDTSINASSQGLDGDGASLHEDMMRTNHDLLEKQVQLSMETTSMSMKSNLVKLLVETGKGIINNVK